MSESMNITQARQIVKNYLNEDDFLVLSTRYKNNAMIAFAFAIKANDQNLLSDYKKYIANDIEKNGKVQPLPKSSNDGRVITGNTVGIPINIEKGRLMNSYPKSYKFENKQVGVIDYLKFQEDQFNISLYNKKSSSLVKDFETLTELNVKNIKTVRGHEGEPCIQCSIYFKSKLIGFYNGCEWYTGQLIKIENENLIKKKTVDNEIIYFFTDKNNYEITNSNFVNLIEELCAMKKDYKMII